MDSDGSNPRRITTDSEVDYWPTWSPDGTRIAFGSTQDGDPDIYVINIDGTDRRKLTNNVIPDWEPAWSPKGDRIAYSALRDGDGDIYIINPDGTDPVRLTDNDADDIAPSWSPDGAKIVFCTDRDGFWEIYVLDAEGSNQRRITDNQSNDWVPVWSPDGGKIAFTSERDGNFEIYIMNADGSNQTRITDYPGRDMEPSWSPDGSKILFNSDRSGNHEIYIMEISEDLVPGEIIKLTENGVEDDHPVWKPSNAATHRKNTWVRTFEGPDYGALFDIVLTQDGNILAVGATNHLHVPPYSGDALFMKTTLEGDILWERTWGGGGYEQAHSVTPSGDGGYYIFGETDSHGAGDRDFFLLKVTEDGTDDWFRTYGRAHREWPFGMLRLSNGDLLIYGFTESLAGSGRNQYALRVDPYGEVIWEYVGESPEDELVIDALETVDGDLVFAVIIGDDASLVKLDAGGNVRWANRYELAGWQFASQVAETDDGGFLLAGFLMINGSRQQADTWLAHCTSTGELAWETSFGDTTHDDYAQSLIPLKDGTYLIGGLGNGIRLSRIDENGSLLWTRSLVGQTVYAAEALIELQDGGFLVAGLIQLINGRSYDAILLRTDSQGLIGE
jgi:WD40 repeat protein